MIPTWHYFKGHGVIRRRRPSLKIRQTILCGQPAAGTANSSAGKRKHACFMSWTGRGAYRPTHEVNIESSLQRRLGLNKDSPSSLTTPTPTTPEPSSYIVLHSHAKKSKRKKLWRIDRFFTARFCWCDGQTQWRSLCRLRGASSHSRSPMTCLPMHPFCTTSSEGTRHRQKQGRTTTMGFRKQDRLWTSRGRRARRAHSVKGAMGRRK